MDSSLEKMKYDYKKEQLKQLIKDMGQRLLDDDEDEKASPDLDYYKDRQKGPEATLEQVNEPRERVRVNQEDPEELLEHMGEHEEEEIAEGDERKDKDEDMLGEIRGFMRQDKSEPEALKNKRSKYMRADPADVPQRTQRDFKARPDNFDAERKMSKKNKMKR